MQYSTLQCDPFPTQLMVSGVTGALRNAEPGTQCYTMLIPHKNSRKTRGCAIPRAQLRTAVHGGFERMLRAD